MGFFYHKFLVSILQDKKKENPARRGTPRARWSEFEVPLWSNHYLGPYKLVPQFEFTRSVGEHVGTTFHVWVEVYAGQKSNNS